MRISEFKDMVKLVRHATYEKEDRVILQCINVSSDGEHTHFVVSDGLRLAHSITYLAGIPDGNYWLHSEGVQGIMKAKDGWQSIPELKSTEGTYPNWKAAIPDVANSTAITVAIEDLLAATKAIKDVNLMRVYLKGNELLLTGTVALGNEIKLTAEVAVDNDSGMDAKFAINPKYVYELCKAIPVKAIPYMEIYIGGVVSPVLFRHPAIEEVIMPMFVNWGGE